MVVAAWVQSQPDRHPVRIRGRGSGLRGRRGCMGIGPSRHDGRGPGRCRHLTRPGPILDDNRTLASRHRLQRSPGGASIYRAVGGEMIATSAENNLK